MLDWPGAVKVKGVYINRPLGFEFFYCAASGATAKGIGVPSPALCITNHFPMKAKAGIQVIIIPQRGKVRVFIKSIVRKPATTSNGLTLIIRHRQDCPLVLS